MAAARELVLQTPRIETSVDPHEFELLIDIVSTVFLLPPPTIDVLAADWSLVLESETPEVDVIRSAYVDTRQQLVCIQKEAVTLLCMLGAGQSSATLQTMRGRLDTRGGSGKFLLTELKVLDALEPDLSYERVSAAMKEYVVRCKQRQPSPLGLHEGLVCVFRRGVEGHRYTHKIHCHTHRLRGSVC